jgi:hypothetical protein
VPVDEIVNLLNSEIERLTRARNLLLTNRLGAYRGTSNNLFNPRRRRKMSAETKRKISEMMKKRWAQRRRQ